ncbi:hypothetical protein ACJ72_02497 [Emergomyces africanus]|uniref:Endonuclease/exonuclease/phosphatase domain-containing protein n=1 Tax=Emergomyces africanus TaxID=1955775 RepID=A0A1B7P298_9EURO|nr:hypothetical protein ACJ72_02497 [Emergomyces africanus]
MAALNRFIAAVCATIFLWPTLIYGRPSSSLAPRGWPWPWPDKSLSLRLMTFNVRYAANASGREKPWTERRGNLVTQVAFAAGTADNIFVGMQEVLHSQLEDIVSGLNNHPSSGGNDWVHIGVGRDDGKQKGEYSPILYRKSVWELVETSTKWLSETPDVPSYGWGAGNRRIVTIGVFQHKRSRELVLVMNTHLDHQVSEARLHGSELIIKLIGEYKKKQQYRCRIAGVMLTGDFNSEEGQEAYQVVTKSGVLVDPVKKFGDKNIYGNRKTFTGFDSDIGVSRIDYVFVGQGNLCGRRNSGTWDVSSYAVLPNRFDDGIIFSDHRAVVADARS